ncbi:hypothetical protein Hanom_Chr09g00803971 [Helianthus anomalus]
MKVYGRWLMIGMTWVMMNEMMMKVITGDAVCGLNGSVQGDVRTRRCSVCEIDVWFRCSVEDDVVRMKDDKQTRTVMINGEELVSGDYEDGGGRRSVRWTTEGDRGCRRF